MVYGPPGVGKTSIIGQAADKVGLDTRTFALPTCEAVDLRGLPQVVKGQTTWASPMPQEGKGVILMDELSSAPPDVQVAAHHIVWAERGSDMNLGPGWHVVMTGNQAKDKTVYRALSGPLRNRLVQLYLETNLTDWSKWAIENEMRPEILGFLRGRQELLTTKDIPAEGAFVSPRSWESCSRLMRVAASERVTQELYTGCIGLGAATEFLAYIKHVADLPSIQSILSDPKRAPIPKNLASIYAIVTSLAYHTRHTDESAMAYCKRLPAEYAFLYINDIKDRYDIRQDDDVRDWIAEHPKMFKRDS